ncbi:MAG: 4-hydroxy-tetrahydrodipicolinate reductase [Burkholderiaceae bacterium]
MKLAIAGACGRMGQMLIEATLAAPDMELPGALERAGSPALGRDAGEFMGRATGVIITDDLLAIAAADVLIDFTRPEATLAHLPVCAANGVKVVIGTTGFDAAGRAAIADAATRTALVFAPNMSVGVNAAFKLLEEAARILGGYDVEIVEMHHRHKVDAPSGTALEMGRVIARAQGVDLEDVAVYERYGHTGERKPGSIGFATLRGGDVVGDHTVIFAAPGERIEISHKSSSRLGYAHGSLRAARFLASQERGQFDMSAVLGLA